MKEDWYKIIEPKIRPLVKLLRNNGFNTTCSCGHEMTVEFALGNHLGEVEQLATFLVENGYKGFRIDIRLTVPKNGFWDRRATVYLKDRTPKRKSRKVKGR